MKRFFYASAAILMLAIAYHLGASTATAQSPRTPVGFCFAGDRYLVLDQKGDLFEQKTAGGMSYSVAAAQATYLGNLWTGARKDSK